MQKKSNYIVIMKTQLIQIGNSKGVRLPKAIIEQCKLEKDVEIEINNNKLILYSESKVRKGWAESFKKMNKNTEDSMIFPDTMQSDWDDSEWVW
jgi:antitoxin MazE